MFSVIACGTGYCPPLVVEMRVEPDMPVYLKRKGKDKHEFMS